MGVKSALNTVLRNRRVYSKMRSFFDRYPRVQPILRGINQLTLKIQGPRPITFSGWGLTSEHSLPWDMGEEGALFLRTANEVKEFQFKGSTEGMGGHLDELLWRHWIVQTAVEHAVSFCEVDKINLVECGVAEGVTAYFALKRTESSPMRRDRDFYIHLYDAWAPMRSTELLPSEWWREGTYDELSVERTQHNLERYAAVATYHVGHIPDSFEKGDHPDQVAFLSIDLNSALPTIAVCEFFLPRIPRNGVILFDDYAHTAYSDTRKHVDEFFAGRPGLLWHIPTGQAAFIVG